MSDLTDILKFEGFNLKGIGKKLKANPARLLYGAIDPASTKVWNKVLGRDDKAVVDQMGGATKGTYEGAQAAGIDTKAGKTMQDVAHVVAAYFAGSYGAGQLGALGGAGGGSAGVGAGQAGAAAGAGGGVVGTGAAGAGAAGAAGAGAGATSVLPTVIVSGTSAGGAASALPGVIGGGVAAGSAAAGAGGTGGTEAAPEGDGAPKPGAADKGADSGTGQGNSWEDLLRGPQQQEQRQQPLEQDEVMFDAEGRPYIASSRRLKKPSHGTERALIQRGASGADQIDQNGVQIAAIQALNERFDRIAAQLKKRKSK